ncbi:hypothetical protein PInf_023278 [Phytophthora infestans]|nr:hypothetical protein PInf_023278 [Phytophthora infestans]
MLPDVVNVGRVRRPGSEDPPSLRQERYEIVQSRDSDPKVGAAARSAEVDRDQDRTNEIKVMGQEQICYHKGGDLFAGDIGEDLAIIPEVSLTTKVVKIDHIQLDPDANTLAEGDRQRQEIWKSRHLLIGKGNDFLLRHAGHFNEDYYILAAILYELREVEFAAMSKPDVRIEIEQLLASDVTDLNSPDVDQDPIGEGHPKSTMGQVQISGATLKHAAFSHLTRVKWEALHRLVAVSGNGAVALLLSSATPDQQLLAAQEFMECEHAGANRRVSTSSRPFQNDVVKFETSTYSNAGKNRLPLNRLYREIDIAIASRRIEASSAKVNFLLFRLAMKAK